MCPPPPQITVKAYCEGMTADCGLFALAFVIAAVHGHNPTELYFEQGKMRPHRIESLQKMEASMFPVIKPKTQKEEKGAALTSYHSSLLHLLTSRLRKNG